MARSRSSSIIVADDDKLVKDMIDQSRNALLWLEESEKDLDSNVNNKKGHLRDSSCQSHMLIGDHVDVVTSTTNNKREQLHNGIHIGKEISINVNPRPPSSSLSLMDSMSTCSIMTEDDSSSSMSTFTTLSLPGTSWGTSFRITESEHFTCLDIPSPLGISNTAKEACFWAPKFLIHGIQNVWYSFESFRKSHSLANKELQIAQKYCHSRDFNSAVVHYSRARQIFSTIDKGHRMIKQVDKSILECEQMGVLIQLALSLHREGQEAEVSERYSDAYELYKKSLNSLNEISVKHPLVPVLLTNLGTILWKMGRYTEAAESLEQSLEVNTQVFRDDDDSGSSSATFSRRVAHHSRQYSSLSRKDHPDDTNALYTLGCVYLAKGSLERAIKFYTKALKLQKRMFGPYHESVAKTLSQIGITYNRLGKIEKAMKLFKIALSIQKACLKRNHVDIAATLNCIGVIHEKRGSYKKAMKAYTEALSIYESNFGHAPHVDIAVTLNNIGEIHRHCFELDIAMDRYLEALKITEKLLGKNHRNTCSVIHNIGHVHFEYGRIDSAQQCYSEVLQIQENCLGEDTIDYANTLDSLGKVYERQGNIIKAKKHFRKALQTRRRVMGASHYYVAVTLSQYGNFLCRIQSIEDARKAFTEARQIYRINGNNAEVIDVDVQLKALEERALFSIEE